MDNYNYNNFGQKNDNSRETHIAITIIAVLLTALITFSVSWVFFINSSLNSSLKNNIPLVTNTADRESALNNVVNTLHRYYYKDFDENLLTEGAMVGMIDALGDPYTQFISGEDYKAYLEDVTGEYSGIGIVVMLSEEYDGVVIVSPIEGTPGERAGLRAGDLIVKIGEYDATVNNLEEAVSYMKGPEGTLVAIEVIKKESGTRETLTIKREKIHNQTVRHEMIDDLGYIRISQFTTDTATEFETAFSALKSKQMKGLVIDLRSNPGGIIDSANAIADYLVPEGTIVYTLDRNGNREDYKSKASYEDIPLVVLIDEGSASASEILSGALKDYDRAKFVGTKSFGKGLVQTTVPLETGDWLKVTIASFYTPKGNEIQGIGITPDYVVENTVDKSYLNMTLEEDVQLQKALELLE